MARISRAPVVGRELAVSITILRLYGTFKSWRVYRSLGPLPLEVTLALQLFWLPIFSCVLWLSCALHRGHAPEGDAASWQGSPCKKLCHTVLTFCLPNCELKIALFFINSACTKYFVIRTNNWHLPEVVWLTTSRISACTQICQTPKHLPITTCSTCQAASSVWQRELLQPCLLGFPCCWCTWNILSLLSTFCVGFILACYLSW